jgi:hypothetical protein
MTKPQAQQTPEQQAQALAEFKSKANLLERDKGDDAACFRFLRARQYNVDKAVDMYNAYPLFHFYLFLVKCYVNISILAMIS